MAIGFDKQPGSRPNVYQNVGISTSHIFCSNPFQSGTQQVRVFSGVAGWISIDQSTSATLVTSTNVPGTGMFLPASASAAEYFIATPGQILTFCCTSTATTGFLSVTEMA